MHLWCSSPFYFSIFPLRSPIGARTGDRNAVGFLLHNPMRQILRAPRPLVRCAIVALELSSYISRALNVAREITRRIFRNHALVSAGTAGHRRERRIVRIPSASTSGHRRRFAVRPTYSLKAWKSYEMLSFSNEISRYAAEIFSKKVLRSAIQDDRISLSTRQVFLCAERCAFGIRACFV